MSSHGECSLGRRRVHHASSNSSSAKTTMQTYACGFREHTAVCCALLRAARCMVSFGVRYTGHARALVWVYDMSPSIDVNGL
jgi:hypothetical protein